MFSEQLIAKPLVIGKSQTTKEDPLSVLTNEQLDFFNAKQFKKEIFWGAHSSILIR